MYSKKRGFPLISRQFLLIVFLFPLWLSAQENKFSIPQYRSLLHGIDSLVGEYSSLIDEEGRFTQASANTLIALCNGDTTIPVFDDITPNYEDADESLIIERNKSLGQYIKGIEDLYDPSDRGSVLFDWRVRDTDRGMLSDQAKEEGAGTWRSYFHLTKRISGEEYRNDSLFGTYLNFCVLEAGIAFQFDENDQLSYIYFTGFRKRSFRRGQYFSSLHFTPAASESAKKKWWHDIQLQARFRAHRPNPTFEFPTQAAGIGKVFESPTIPSLPQTSVRDRFMAEFGLAYFFTPKGEQGLDRFGLEINVGGSWYGGSVQVDHLYYEFPAIDKDSFPYTRIVHGRDISETYQILYLDLPIRIKYEHAFNRTKTAGFYAGFVPFAPSFTLLDQFSGGGTFDYFGQYEFSPILFGSYEDIPEDHFYKNRQSSTEGKKIGILSNNLIIEVSTGFFFQLGAKQTIWQLGVFYRQDRNNLAPNSQEWVSVDVDQYNGFLPRSQSFRLNTIGFELGFRIPWKAPPRPMRIKTLEGPTIPSIPFDESTF